MAWLCVMLLLGVGCGCQQVVQATQRSEFEKRLAATDRANKPISSVEADLRLGDPVDVRWPSFTDPMWWFSYILDDNRIEIGANAEDVRVGQDISDRSKFFYTGYFWVGPSKGSATRRIDIMGRASRTQRLGQADVVSNCYERYLERCDMTRQLTIAEVERVLRLGRPSRVERPAFVEPMWWFYYQESDCWIGLAANCDAEVEAGKEVDNRQVFVFTGYWAVSRLSHK